MKKIGLYLIIISLTSLSSCGTSCAIGNGDGYDQNCPSANNAPSDNTSPPYESKFHEQYYLDDGTHTCINSMGDTIISYLEKIVKTPDNNFQRFDDICSNSLIDEKPISDAVGSNLQSGKFENVSLDNTDFTLLWRGSP